jgi:hypothetical protein
MPWSFGIVPGGTQFIGSTMTSVTTSLASGPASGEPLLLLHPAKTAPSIDAPTRIAYRAFKVREG